MIRKTVLLLLVAGVLGACGDDDGADTASASGSASGASASGSGSGSAEAGGCEIVGGSDDEPTNQALVTLDEFSIEASVTSLGGGVVTITATNDGEIDHEVVVLEGPPADVEVDDDGEVDETNLVGEIEAFPPGETCEGSFELAAGEYTLLCAIVEESGESHDAEGMVTGLTVT